MTDEIKADVDYLANMATRLQQHGCTAGESFIVSATWELRRSVDCLEAAIRESAIDPDHLATIAALSHHDER